uniref:Sulfurtransferase n=1 Tax=Acrobeloides nanus TaxID=290746 RepID=A0A914ENU9_9BILA
MALPISSTELLARLDKSDVKVVDVRPLAAYNGWRFGSSARGGHIPGAVAFPSKWLHTVDENEINRLIHAKGIVPTSEIVVYGSGSGENDETSSLINRLKNLNFPKLRVLEGGWTEWTKDASNPVDKLTYHEQLVHVQWLAELLQGKQPEAAPRGRYLLFHVNFGVPEEYQENHIQTAIYLDTNRLESSTDWNRRTPEELDEAVRALGITRDTTVILYGRDTEGDAKEKWPGRRAGQIAACRTAMILYYAGVNDVRLLDGGYDAWVQAGEPVETILRQATPVAAFGGNIPVRPEVIVDIDEAKQILADPEGSALVSVRTWKEHIGLVSGYNYIEPAGRITGDVWGNCGSDAYHMQHYRNVDNTMRPYPEIASNWEITGILPSKWVAFYCGTGWRASETWFYAFLMGWQRVAVYDGGWFEWSKDPINNPIEVGEEAHVNEFEPINRRSQKAY